MPQLVVLAAKIGSEEQCIEQGLSEANEKPPPKEPTIPAGIGERPFHCFQVWICRPHLHLHLHPHLHLVARFPQSQNKKRASIEGMRAQSAFEIRA